MTDKQTVILVCGPRDWGTTELEVIALRSMLLGLVNYYPGCLIIHGGATGADSIASAFAINYGVDMSTYFADWHSHGRAAGPIRNKRMLDEGNPDIVVACMRGSAWTVGTGNMVALAVSNQRKLIKVGV